MAKNNTYNRAYNFSAGPAALPEAVLEQARDEMLNWQNTGASIMEMSHRGTEFRETAKKIEADLRELLNIPSNYKVVFVSGGGRSQFAMAPLNLAGQNHKVAYALTGIWGMHAMKEAALYCDTHVVFDGEPAKFTHIAPEADWVDYKDCAYLHIVDNETINGVEFPFVPDTGDVPLVADMSSNILSRSFDVNKFGLIYACAQKNAGPAGVTIAIVREDLLEREPFPNTPSMFRYRTHTENDSLYNTPPVYPWYILGLVLEWLKKQGGVAAIAEINRRKAQRLYDYIDSSDFYTNPIEPSVRSNMNVPFTLADDNLNEAFLTSAAAAGMIGLKGHRFLGGMRASIYNAMPEDGIVALIDFMQEFERQHG